MHISVTAITTDSAATTLSVATTLTLISIYYNINYSCVSLHECVHDFVVASNIKVGVCMSQVNSYIYLLQHQLQLCITARVCA